MSLRLTKQQAAYQQTVLDRFLPGSHYKPSRCLVEDLATDLAVKNMKYDQECSKSITTIICERIAAKWNGGI